MKKQQKSFSKCPIWAEIFAPENFEIQGIQLKQGTLTARKRKGTENSTYEVQINHDGLLKNSFHFDPCHE